MRKVLFLFLLFSLFVSSSLLEGCQPRGSLSSGVTFSWLESCNIASGTGNAECGVLRVPEDRANPKGRKLDLKVVVARAREADHAPDPLFYLTGGPGVPATSAGVVSSVRTYLWNINARRDVVFLDQRGSNDKHRLTCEPFPSLITDATPQQQVDDWMKQCLSGLDGDPRFYTTASFVRDIEDARAALGYDKINFYGISYGVTAEQVYMRMFPEHVRAVVMDHGTALDLPFRYVLPRASQAALDQIFTYCEQDADCRAAYPEIRGDWKKLLDRLAKGPVITSIIPEGSDKPGAIMMEDIVLGAHDLMYKSGTYRKLPFLVHLLANTEDWTPIVKSLSAQNNNTSTDNRMLLMVPVIFCFDPAWGTQPDQVVRYSPDTYYTNEEIIILQGQQKICAALPKPDPALIYGPGKPAPLSALMLNSLIDPQNPPSNMDLALKEFTNSRVVIEPTEGHDTSGSACRWSIVTEYIQQGSVDGLDTACMKEQKPSFVIGSN